MFRLYPDTRSPAQLFASKVIQMSGEKPQHIAIIMDGNRRFAKSQGIHRRLGHKAGVIKVKEVTRWIFELQIPELTLYAFSIENFNRSKDQVDELMNLFQTMFIDIVNSLESYINADICIQFIGNLDLLPAKLKPNMAKIMWDTRHCTSVKINFAMAYTGRNGLERSLQGVQAGISSGQLDSRDVSEYLVEQTQNLVHSRPVDILIRTGGDKRISDFMMWESTQAYIHFMDVTWPEFGCWQVLDCLVKYQMFRRRVPKLPCPRSQLTKEQRNRADNFLENVRDIKWDKVKRYLKNSHIPDGSGNQVCVETYIRESVKSLLDFA